MAQETERKFLVASGEFKKMAMDQFVIKQGYISSVPERTVRIRTRGNEGYITIKGIGNSSGATRYEWEKKIPLAEAEELLKICEPGRIEKTRYRVAYAGNIFEVDEFSGQNRGLVIAEIELQNENDHFDKPSWLGEEVTGDARYYNSMLMKKPFTEWKSN